MEEKAELIQMLNEAMSLEYGALFLIPQHMARVKDEETKRQLRLIEEVELEHAEKTAQLIYQLGGEPKADLPLLQPRSEVREILEAHLQGEMRSIDVYRRAESKCTDAEMRKTLAKMREDEEGHLRLLQRTLERV